jgi:hypothetical protein
MKPMTNQPEAPTPLEELLQRDLDAWIIAKEVISRAARPSRS